jgi:hypothetical protein
LFQYELDIAVHNNSLGGWSIEKELIHYVKSILPSKKSILEFGSGNGTNALLKFYSVTSIEHNPQYSYSRGDYHDCLLAPIQNDWYRRDQVEKGLNQNHDLIIVDGPPGELRGGILMNMDLFKKISTPIIFDDVDRELDKDIMVTFCKKLEYEYKIIKGGRKSFAFCYKSD